MRRELIQSAVSPLTLAIFGATGGTGRLLVEQAVSAGHRIRALVRSPERARLPAEVQLVYGDVRDAGVVAETVRGSDAVISCLGSRLGATFTSRGRIVAPATASIIAAMRGQGVMRLLAISTYGAGDSWLQLRPTAKVMMSSLMRGELADKNAMEAAIVASGLGWTLVRPVNLKDGPRRGCRLANPAQRLGLRDWISRADVAAFMLSALCDRALAGRACLISTD